MPVLLASVAAEHGMFMRNPKFLQVSYPGFRVLPLLPNKAPQPAHYPNLKPLEEGFCFRQTEVSPPADKEPVQFLDNLPQAFATIALCQRFDLILEAFETFHMDSHLGLPTHLKIGKSKELA